MSETPYWHGIGDQRLEVPSAWVARLIQCGMTTLASVEAASDGQLAIALGVMPDVVPEVRAAVATLRDARAKADALHAKAVAAEQERLQREEARLADQRRQREIDLAEAARVRAEEAAEAARVKAEADAEAARIKAEAARIKAEADAAAYAEAVARELARFEADVKALRSDPFRHSHEWPPGPSQFDNIGLSPRMHAIVRRADWISLAAIRDTPDHSLLFQSNGIGPLGLKEIRNVIGYNEIDSLGLSVRAANGLRNCGLSTVAQVNATSDEELMRTPNFGRHALREVRRVCGPGPVASPRPRPPAYEMPPLYDIDYLELGFRSYNVLKQEGLLTIEAINAISDQELLRTPNFGRISLQEVRDAVGRFTAERQRRRSEDVEDMEALIAAELAQREASWARQMLAFNVWPERARP